MIPVMQTIHGENGNCLQACIASLFHLELNDVPHFIEFDNWREKLDEFLKPYGLMSLSIRIEGEAELPKCWMLVCGRTMPERWHAVVGFGGEIIHDPRPEPEPFITDDRQYDLFVTIDPSMSPKFHFSTMTLGQAVNLLASL